MPRVHMLMPYFAIVYATPQALSHAGSMFNGGEMFSTWAFSALRRYGIAACHMGKYTVDRTVQQFTCDVRKVPLAFTWFIRS